MKFKKLLLSFSLFFILFYENVYAYSDKIYVGGENIGININQKYVSVVGFYEVNGSNIAKDSGFLEGDLIYKIEGIEIDNVQNMINIINQNFNRKQISIKVIRAGELNEIILPIVIDHDGILKTGLYVKDKITGIGTLTYIDPNTKIYGALGHEIIDKNTLTKVEITGGTIFKSDVISITPSERGIPGEKNAKFYRNEVIGDINKNEEEGIFGTYSDNIDSELVEVGKIDEIIPGKAYIRTVIEGNQKKDYEINILEVYKKEDTKNILFEIVDSNLLEVTNGVVAGMSGSPILQNGKIIAACTHVVVNDPHKGFAIAIENMLTEGEK